MQFTRSEWGEDMKTATTQYELRRQGKRHQYDCYVGDAYIGDVRRALIGKWVTAHVGGSPVFDTFSTKEEAAKALVAFRVLILASEGRS